MLEGPYLVATALPGAASLAPTADGRLLVATRQGAVVLDPSGTVVGLGLPADRVTTTPGHQVLLHEGVVAWRAERSPADGPAATLALPGATDVLGWTPDSVLVALPEQVVELSLSRAEVHSWSQEPGVTGLALGASPGQVLAVRGQDVLEIDTSGGRVLRAGVVGLRQVATDREGRLWGLLDASLAELTPGGPVVHARHLGNPMDLHRGTGGALPTGHMFVADATGTVAYVPLPAVSGSPSPRPSLAKPAAGR